MYLPETGFTSLKSVKCKVYKLSQIHRGARCVVLVDKTVSLKARRLKAASPVQPPPGH